MEYPVECCGLHAVCEREKLMKAATNPVEYYDDEELDAYAGIPQDAYPPEAVREFEEVFYTLLKHDVAGWLHSLQLRGIELPDALKDEALLLITDEK